jgi:ferredoxin-NADP reductase
MQLYLLTGRTGEGVTPFEPDSLRGLVPDITERDVYVCGPPAMTSAVLGALRKLKVPGRRIHSERFGLARPGLRGDAPASPRTRSRATG